MIFWNISNHIAHCFFISDVILISVTILNLLFQQIRNHIPDNISFSFAMQSCYITWIRCCKKCVDILWKIAKTCLVNEKKGKGSRRYYKQFSLMHRILSLQSSDNIWRCIRPNDIRQQNEENAYSGKERRTLNQHA